MTQLNRHRIRRQVLELTVSADLSRAALQEEQLRACWHRVLPDLCAVFDASAGADQLLRIDRLELDLGELGESDWEPRFRERLVSELTRRLSEFKVKESESPGKGNARPEGGTLDAFLFFLAHGHLPWWFPRPETTWTSLLESHREQIPGAALRALVARDARALARLVASLSDEMLEEVVARWAGLPESALVLARIRPAGLSKTQLNSWRRRGWLLLLDWIMEDGFAASHGVECLRRLRELRREFVSNGPAAVDSNPAAKETSQSDSFWHPALPMPWCEWWEAPVAPPRATSTTTHAKASTVVPFRRPGSLPGTKPQRASAAPADEPVYLPCVGVVLVHPFLEPLFRDRGLLEGRGFRDAAARHRAVSLVGHLSWGLTELPEHDLAMAKLLCGLSVDEPLDLGSLEEGDTDACDQLLSAVLGHWTALRGSSRDWLRTQFLVRDGKLEVVDGGDRLTVERRAQDVLLARLPWGFGVIALPWMRGRLFVSWID